MKSLRTRLIIWNSLLLAGLFIVFGVLVNWVASSVMMSSVDRELIRATDRFVKPRPRPPEGFRFGGGGGPPPPEGPRNIAAPTLFGFDGKGIGPNENAKLVDQASFDVAKTGKDGWNTVRVDGQDYRVVSRKLSENDMFKGVVQMAYPLADVQRALGGLQTALLTLVPIALLGAALGSLWMTGRVLQPVRRISETADRISAEELSARLPVAGDDEFAELAETFNGMLDRVELAFVEQQKLIERQRRFTADASHELRSPLTVIKANASLGLDPMTPPDATKQCLEDIGASAEGMSKLVDDLMLLAKSDSGQLASERISVSAHELIEAAAQRVKRPGKAAITIEQGDPHVTLTVNEDQVVRLLANLFSNSLKHTPEDGKVVGTLRADNGSVIFTVADNGAGIAPEHLPRLGERFYRPDSSRSRREGGTGLGLAICRAIVEAHGGTMRFMSELGVGTTVEVRMPADQKSVVDE